MNFRKRSKSNPLDDIDIEFGLTDFDKKFKFCDKTCKIKEIKKQNIVKRFFKWIYIKLTTNNIRRY